MTKKRRKKHSEATCQKCGKCCQRKTLWQKAEKKRPVPVVLDIYCPALDEKTHLCRIYAWRHSNLAYVLRGGTACLKMVDAIKRHEQPTDCPYTPLFYTGTDFDPDALALYKQARFFDYCDIITQTSQQREAIDEVLKLMGRETEGEGSC